MRACQTSRLSFFQEADRYEEGQYNAALHRLFSLMRKMGAKALVTEQLRGDQPELKEETEAISKYAPSCVDSASWWRLSFFSSSFASRAEIPFQPFDSLLAYAVILKFKAPDDTNKCILWESVVRVPCLLNNYIHCAGFFQTLVAGHRFEIYGSFFCQQNGYSTCCVHAALRMLLSNYAWPIPQRISYEDINKRLGYDHATKPVPAGGLKDEDIYRALVSFAGISADGIDVSGEDLLTDYIYSYVESGIPVLFLFSVPNSPGHIVPLIGHTLNTDIWVSWPYFANYAAVKNTGWVDHCIVNDDNLGMYLCLPQEFLKPENCYAIAIGPEKVALRPRFADLTAKLLLENTLMKIPPDADLSYWLKEVVAATRAQGASVVLRTFLISKSSYLTHLAGMRDNDGEGLVTVHLEAMSSRLPESFWISELTLPDLYTANRHKVGEVLISKDKSIGEDTLAKDTWEALIGARFPGFMLFKNQDGTGFDVFSSPPLPLRHVPIYENLDCPVRPQAW